MIAIVSKCGCPSLHQLSQSLQHLLTIVLKVSIYFIDLLILHHPQSAVGFLDEAGIVTHQNDPCREEEGRGRREEGKEGEVVEKGKGGKG